MWLSCWFLKCVEEKFYKRLLYSQRNYGTFTEVGQGYYGGCHFVGFYCADTYIYKMKTEDLLFVLGALVAVALLLWYLFGNSPTIDQLLVGLMVANLTFSFKIYGDLQKHLGEHQGPQI